MWRICPAARHIVKVDGRRGLFRGLPPRLVSSAVSTVVRTKVKQVSWPGDARDRRQIPVFLQPDRLFNVTATLLMMPIV